MYKHEKRELWEVVVLDRGCELGHEGERAVVIDLTDRYMTLLFPDRARSERMVYTGRDYLYLKSTVIDRGAK
jgi:hypothetical protein